MKHGVRRFPALWRATRLARRWFHARRGAYPDWQSALSADSALWESARNAAQGGPRVLMATSIGSYAHAVTLESAVAAALTFRGAEVHALLCDGAMTACAECDASLYPDVAKFVADGPGRDLCRDCAMAGRTRVRAARTQGPSLQRLADTGRPRRGAADCRRAASGRDQVFYTRRSGHR